MYELWYAHLVSMMRYPVDETFTCLIPDVFVGSPRGEVITSDFGAVVQSSRLNWDDVFMPRVPVQGQCLPGTFVSLLAKNGNNYGHWLIDILPRTSLIPDNTNNICYAVPTTFPSYKQESLELLGITPEQIVQLPPGWHRLEQALVCHAAQRSLRPKREHILTMVDRLTKAVFGTEERPVPWRRVYVSRSKAQRRIVNEEALLPVLQAYGFETVFCEDLSLREQIRLFAETKYLLGAHGSGLNNDILCPSGAIVIELYNPVRWNYCVRGVASLMGHEHWFLFGRNASVDFDMILDPKKLEKLLAYVFGTGDFIEPVY
ncbi:MAG: glycosyltransferase family 61 protein [Chloroflexales bacterium]|nr:glycosyltransferase family 61 protein [Chloroflexales bacterium]